MITAIVLSKDRPAQLDLLLRSLDLNGAGLFNVSVCASPVGDSFEQTVRFMLGDTLDTWACFMCDDGILYRPLEGESTPMSDELCFSLRLGSNTIRRYPSDTIQVWPGADQWNWTESDPDASDFGYPGSLDGHVFRTSDLRRLLAGRSFPNPTALECALQAACLEAEWASPLMRSFERSVYVGNPVNRVSGQSRVRFGERFPAPAAELAEWFAAGERLSLEAMDFTGVDGAHSEVELRWAPR